MLLLQAVRQTRLWLASVATTIALVAAPTTAGAFSFGPFNPGEFIDSLLLVTPGLGTNAVEFTTADNQLEITAYVSEIVTNQRTINITLGDLLWNSQVELVGGTENVTEPFAPFFGGAISAQFFNGLAADITLLDVGPGGAGILFNADYNASLQLNSSPTFGLPVAAQLSGDFDLRLGEGDADFETRFGTAGNYFANLSSILSDGVPVGNDMCVMIEGGCDGLAGDTIDNFTVNPGATVERTTVPEPSSGLLLGLALLGLAGREHRRAA